MSGDDFSSVPPAPPLSQFHSQISSTAQRIIGQLDALNEIGYFNADEISKSPMINGYLDDHENPERHCLLSDLMQWTDRRCRQYTREERARLDRMQRSNRSLERIVEDEFTRLNADITRRDAKLFSVNRSVDLLHVRLQDLLSGVSRLFSILQNGGTANLTLSDPNEPPVAPAVAAQDYEVMALREQREELLRAALRGDSEALAKECAETARA
jgi:signal transduction histidine kinase